jgi:hypothetical protein
VSWFDFVLAYLLSAVFLLGPGYAFLAAARVPAWFRLVLSPLLSAAWVAALGIVFAWIHLRFNGASVLVATALGAAVVAALFRFTPVGAWFGRDRDTAQVTTPLAVWAALAAGMAVSFVVWLINFVRPLSGPAAITRAYDVPWHASIIKQFMVSGNGSTLTSAQIEHTTGSSFYPAAWHDMVALVAGLGHYPVFGGINAVVFAELTLVWPLSIAAFVGVLLGRRSRPVFLAVVFGVLFTAFPLHLLTWGIIYSNLYGFALLPALLALGVLLFSDRISWGMGRRLVAVLFVVGFVADAIAQPNAVFTAALVLLPFVLGQLYRWVAAARPRGGLSPRVSGVGVCVVLVVVAGIAWVGLAHTSMLARTTTLDRPTAGSLPRAVYAALFEGFSNTHEQYLLGFLIIVGALMLLFLQRRRQWLLASHALLSLCYIVSASQPIEQHLHWLRMNFTGYWYNDFHRLAAATVVTAIPLAVVAMEWLAATMSRLSITHTPPAISTAMVMALVTAGTLTSMPMTKHRGLLQSMSATDSAMSAERRAFLQQVARTVPAGQVVANNPFDGSAYGWSLFGLDTFFKSYSQNWIGSMSPAMLTVSNRLDKAASDPQVCDVLREYDVTYALAMSTKGRLVNNVWHHIPIWQGMHLTRDTPGFTTVLHQPGMTLYKITACQ